MNTTAYSATCPECGKVGSSRSPIPIGTKVRCKGCGQTFATGDDLPAYEPVASVPDVPIAIVTTDPSDPDIPIRTRPTRTDRGEPLYFSLLEILGYVVIVGGVLQLLWSGYRFGEFTLFPPPVPPDDRMAETMQKVTGGVLLWMLEMSLGGLIASLILGFLLWIAVDITRSLRKTA